MSVSDLTFLFYCLPLFFAVYYILPFRFKNAALVLGSFAFYFIGAGARDTLLLSGVLLLHYALARAMAGKEVRTRKVLLIIALAADLFCLVYFKYAAFILENLGKLTGTAFSLVELALPLGVSFYLFQSAGYLIDVYRGEEAEKNLINYAAFTIAFPQLTMGPILRYREWRGALKARTVTREDVFSGFELFVVGLCFKVLLADQLAPLWASLERIGYEYLSMPLAWLGAVSYSLQLYFDFSGYSLMAMGLGQMLALPVPRNFDLPYTARSVSEFYRRWHITLGTWFRDYVYIPLGGSRNGNARIVHQYVHMSQHREKSYDFRLVSHVRLHGNHAFALRRGSRLLVFRIQRVHPVPFLFQRQRNPQTDSPHAARNHSDFFSFVLLFFFHTPPPFLPRPCRRSA